MENGLSTEVVDHYFVERAKGGVGLMELSQLMIKPPFGVYMPDWEYDSARRFPLMNTPEIVPGLKRLSDAVHSYDSKMLMEVSSWIWLFGPVSAIPFETGLQLKELTVFDIREIQEAFGVASKRVKEGGFDGVDLHGTHGAMIEHFYSPATNRRDDRYGGTLENRMRFLFEVVDVVRASVGDSLAVGMRLCADEKLEAGVTPEYAKKMASLFDGKVDFVNVGSGSAGYFDVLNQAAHQTEPLYIAGGHGVSLSAAVKSAVRKTKVGAVGKILDPIQAEEIIQKGFADYVGMTRALIADPELPRKALEGRLVEIRPCIGTLQDCWGRSVSHEWPMRCTVNPAVGREKERGRGTLKRAERKKKILVIGSGPAGLEVARVASERGHEVSVYEKSREAGGQALLAARLPGRSDIRAIVSWQVAQLKKLGVEIKYGLEVTRDSRVIEFVLGEEKPDAVVIATGSHPVKTGLQLVTYREVPGWDGPNVHSLDEILGDDRELNGRVVVADSTNYIEGPGMAELLARKGAEVILVTPHPQISPQLPNFNQLIYVLTRLHEARVKIISLSWLRRIEHDRVLVHRFAENMEEEILADHVVLNTGRKQNDGLKGLFDPLVREVYEIGDCSIAGGTLRWAIESGYVVGSTI